MLPVSYRCVFKVKILIINIEKSHGTLLYGAHIVDVEKILFDDKIFAITRDRLHSRTEMKETGRKKEEENT